MDKIKIVCDGTSRANTKIYYNDELLNGITYICFKHDVNSHPELTMSFNNKHVELEIENVKTSNKD
jgi:hypothetical protein